MLWEYQVVVILYVNDNIQVHITFVDSKVQNLEAKWTIITSQTLQVQCESMIENNTNIIFNTGTEHNQFSLSL